MAVVLAASVLVMSCSASPGRGLPAFTPFVSGLPIPSLPGDCAVRITPATGDRAVASFPARIERQSQLNSEIFAPVCVNGRGPFSFIVDTGSTSTLIDSGLAARLGVISPSEAATMRPCGSVAFAKVRQFTVGGLPGPSITSVEIGSLATPSFPLAGIVGSDYLSSFAAVRIDYRAQTISLAIGPTKPGGIPAALPKSLLTGTSTQVALRPPPGQITLNDNHLAGLVTVPAVIGADHVQLLVDTGAQSTLVSPAVATRAGLTLMTMTSIAYAGIGCQRQLRYFRLPGWTLGNQPLEGQPVASLPNFLMADGSLGSGTLQTLSPVVIDYQDALLLFRV